MLTNGNPRYMQKKPLPHREYAGKAEAYNKPNL